MTPEDRKAILRDINRHVARSNLMTGPDYPAIFRDVADHWQVSLEDVHSIVRDDAAGTMGAG